MKTRAILLSMLLLPTLVWSANIDKATITEVVNSVSIIEPSTRKTSAAQARQLFTAPNVMRTGAGSRAELVAEDSTITRVGQNTVFSFEPGTREIELQRGSLLFQSPSGKGGGTIKTSSASAAVLGTTLIVVATKNGGFKVLLLEGKGRVRGADGSVRTLTAGQLVYALPGGRLSRIFDFRLREQVAAAQLVKGFKKGLPSVAKIQAAIQQQEKQIAKGKALPTNLLATHTPDFALQVDVARDTQTTEINEAPPSPRTTAVRDAIIQNPQLEIERISNPRTSGVSREGTRLLDLDQGGPGLDALNPRLFLAQNTTFATPSVDLSRYAGSDLFQFHSVLETSFARPVNFGSFDGQIQLTAGSRFVTRPGVVLSANAPLLALYAYGDPNGISLPLAKGPDGSRGTMLTSLTQFGMDNLRGDVAISGGNLLLTDVALRGKEGVFIGATAALDIDGSTQQVVTSSSSTAVPGEYSRIEGGKRVNLSSINDMRIRNTLLKGANIQIQAGEKLTLSSVTLADGTNPNSTNPNSTNPNSTNPNSTNPDAFARPPGPATVKLVARDFIGLNRVNLLANDVLIQGRTVALTDVRFRFGSNVALESALGLLAPGPNTGRPVRPGFVNFVRDVRYGNEPAEQFVIVNGSTGNSGPGITIRPSR